MASNEKKKSAREASKLLVVTEETQAQAAEILDKMLVAIKAHTENPALAIIKQQIGKIDALNKAGASLNQIYEHLNSELKLGITPSSFTQYVRKVRQEVGSELYVARGPRKPKTSKEQAKADAPAAQEATPPVAEWKCERCEAEAERRESTKQPGTFFWKCGKCGAFYKDNNGVISSEKLGA